MVVLALPSALRASVLAATAGTLFEATPFVLAAAALPRGRFGRAFAFLGCGCATAGPGALALPAIALCWLAFGPVVAIARAAAGLFLARVVPRPDRDADAEPDPLCELARLAPAAAVAGVLAEALHAALPPGAVPSSGAIALGIVCGALLGACAPCAAGAIAIAAAVRDVSPSASTTILATAGIVPSLCFGFGDRLGSDRSGGERAVTRAAFVLLALACGGLALQGPSGFINPRFVPALVAATALALLCAVRAPVSRARAPAIVPLVLVAALVVGSPLPQRAPLVTTLDDPYPGARLRFRGSLVPSGPGATTGETLVRYTITCCRADAQAQTVRLDRAVAGRPGAWYEADGTLALRDGAYRLNVTKIRSIAAPADPFAYR
ncbi:MAG: hypothetical protein NVSMB21_23130 [Vulcanimicrobiaceae bacterium]